MVCFEVLEDGSSDAENVTDPATITDLDMIRSMLAQYIEEEKLPVRLLDEPYDGRSKTTDNSRNGHSKKTLRTSISQDMESRVPLHTPSHGGEMF